MRPVAVIRPMFSRRPTGIGIAGDAIVGLLPAGLVRTSARLDRWFAAINDGRIPGAVRALARVAMAQVAPWFFPRDFRLVFASHHAPFWCTGRHAVVLYDTIPLQFPEQAPAQTAYYRHGLPRALRCAERVVTISAAARDDFAARGYRAVQTATVIPAYAERIVAVASVHSRRSHELLVVGARYPHKNIDVVLAALEILNRDASAPWKLTLAGCERGLWAKAWGGLEHFERKGWVRVIARVSGEELATLYGSASVLVYPSLAEGQGLPPLEALAAGCPVVCSDLPVLRETCGAAAAYFPATDAATLAATIPAQAGATGAVEVARRQELARMQLALFGRDALAAKWARFLEDWP